MGEYADYEIDRMIDQGFGFPRSRWISRRERKRTNQQIFSQFAEPIHGKFKTGDRVIHTASGVAGTVWATRSGQISWRPDTRVKPGAIWTDETAFRHEGF